MIANRLLLLGNALILLLVVGRRSSKPQGGIGDLPWASFGTELQDIVSEASLSSAALLCLWIVLTFSWLLITLIFERRHRIETAALSKANTKRESPRLYGDASSDPGLAAVSEQTHDSRHTSHAERSGSAYRSETSQTSGLHPIEDIPGHTQGANGFSSAKDLPASTTNPSDISGVLAGVKERNKSLSPEARAEIARLQAALQTLSDQASEEKKKDAATPGDAASTDAGPDASSK